MKCICCEVVLKPLDTEISEHEQVFDYEHRHVGKKCSVIDANNRSWSDGIVGIIAAGYGSTNDGGVYVIGVCDKCLNEKVSEGVVAYIGNNIFRNKEAEETLGKLRKVWIDNNVLKCIYV